jgi:uncharacterized BrkB/YihY/UPF0761 family membrane protein
VYASNTQLRTNPLISASVREWPACIGLAFTLATCFYLFYTSEDTFNAISRVSAKRTLVRKFMIFYPIATLVPVLAGVYLHWSGKLIGSGQAARFFGPLMIQFAGLFLINWLVPNLRVRWYAALEHRTG